MEAQLIVEGIGPWRNFEEIEDALTIDELLMLFDQMGKSKQMHYRVLASFQGINLDDEIEETGEELPQEVLEAERAWQKKKADLIQSGQSIKDDFESMGFGYTRA